MARTYRKEKPVGFDYSSRRYGNKSGCNCPDSKSGRPVKKITNRAERRIAKHDINNGRYIE